MKAGFESVAALAQCGIADVFAALTNGLMQPILKQASRLIADANAELSPAKGRLPLLEHPKPIKPMA
jgi:hypothetical protein